MASMEGGETVFFLSDDELDEVLASFDFNSEIEETQEKPNFHCPFCSKVCISQRGLTRHINCKHSEEKPTSSTSSSTSTSAASCNVPTIFPSQFLKILSRSVSKLAEDECYPEEIRNQFKEFDCASQAAHIYDAIKHVLSKFKGNIEKFYPDFCVLFRDGNIIECIDKHCNVLIGFELANNILSFLTKSKVIDDSLCFELENTDITEKDKEVISYLSGYVVGTLYHRLRFSKKAKGVHHEQCLSFLLACKLMENTEYDTSHHKLIDTKNRGGLWKIKHDVITIFTIAESYFLSATKQFVTKINAEHIVSSLLSDTYVLIYFNSFRRCCEVKKEIGLNVLEDMLTLYIRIRSHSYAKRKQQQHKLNASILKSRSLRTEIKKQTSSLDGGH